MNEGIYIHINKINKCITYLLSIEVNSEEEGATIILLASLSKSYETLVIMLLIGKKMFIVDEVSIARLEIKIYKKPSSSFHIE